MKIKSIDLIYHLEDESGKEEEVKASVGIGSGWSQWGADTPRLADCTYMTEKIHEILNEGEEE